MNKCKCEFDIQPNKHNWILNHTINDYYVFEEPYDTPQNFTFYLEEQLGSINIFDLGKTNLIHCLCDAKKPLLTEEEFEDLKNIVKFCSNARDIDTFVTLIWKKHMQDTNE